MQHVESITIPARRVVTLTGTAQAPGDKRSRKMILSRIIENTDVLINCSEGPVRLDPTVLQTGLSEVLCDV